MPTYCLVDTEDTLRELSATLDSAPRLFIDTEFESTRSGTQLCLLQISAGSAIYLVDAVRLRDLRPLRSPLLDEGKEWVLHAAQQDIPLLEGTLGLRAHRRVFDTQVGWAMIGPEYSVSLSYLIYRVLGIRSGKAHQADDWTGRPLPVSQLEYAAADVASLPALHDHITERLRALGRLEAHYDVVAELLRPMNERTERLELSSYRNAWQLGATEQAALQYLIRWFNDLSERERRHAPEGKTLMSIAMRVPTTARELARIKGVSQRWCDEHGPRLVDGIRQAILDATPDQFEPIDPPPYASFEGIRLDAWLQTLRAELSAELEMAPELAFPSRIMRRLQQALTTVDAGLAPEAVLHGWRQQVVGPSLTRYLESCPAPVAPPVLG